jgi:hypothetical protein
VAFRSAKTGTEADCEGTDPIYYAWYELYPERLFLIEEPVEPGDVLHAMVTQGTSARPSGSPRRRSTASPTSAVSTSAAQRSSRQRLLEA